MKRRVGAILIRNNRVLSTGYNGTPRGLINCNQGGCERCNLGKSCGSNLDECLCLHAEENALLECGRSGGGVEGAVLYCNT
jgi:dCMP deaminase